MPIPMEYLYDGDDDYDYAAVHDNYDAVDDDDYDLNLTDNTSTIVSDHHRTHVKQQVGTSSISIFIISSSRIN